MMVIEGRGKAIEDVFRELRDTLKGSCSLDNHIEIHLATRDDARKVKAFCLMSGCEMTFHEKEGHPVLTVVDRSCRCG
jgi:hypothetical protein